MKKTLLATAALLVAVPTALVAQPMHGGHHGQHGPQGDMTRADVEARTAEHFSHLDENGDGLVTTAEMEAMHAKRMERMAERRAERRAERQERAGERGKHRMERTAERRAERHARRFAAMDANSDGAVSLAELQAKAFERFDKADADGNGVVTEAERKAHRDAMREQRAERRQQRGN
ncbi:hypothetical protein [Sphingomicrobium aestuariivivum]|uniref:hypothetical protein n=1 Tax=Sphingomicrobium aestuariivivum TaxID=1582356 RepID=UPI001FD6B5D8|nr:hypothetical protein [Sphingomicrobium aestuariivivum]MCJ8191571.1 hypothetical protein [Sphingomicrobium aestuariivivum]